MKANPVKLKIKKGATVQVIAGAEKGKSGSVLEVDAKNLRIKVQGIKIQTHYSKQDGLQTREGFFDYSNVKMLEPAKSTEGKASKKKAARK